MKMNQFLGALMVKTMAAEQTTVCTPQRQDKAYPPLHPLQSPAIATKYHGAQTFHWENVRVSHSADHRRMADFFLFSFLFSPVSPYSNNSQGIATTIAIAKMGSSVGNDHSETASPVVRVPTVPARITAFLRKVPPPES